MVQKTIYILNISKDPFQRDHTTFSYNTYNLVCLQTLFYVNR